MRRTSFSLSPLIPLALFSAMASSAALSAEVISYTYDAQGRLVVVSSAGTVNNGIVTTYTNDSADNRSNIKVTGAP
jgi:hypothetical protein